MLNLTLGGGASQVNFDYDHLKPGPESRAASLDDMQQHLQQCPAPKLTELQAATLAYLWRKGVYHDDARATSAGCCLLPCQLAVRQTPQWKACWHLFSTGGLIIPCLRKSKNALSQCMLVSHDICLLVRIRQLSQFAQGKTRVSKPSLSMSVI